jgi:ATP-dependent DNA helicase RecQ
MLNGFKPDNDESRRQFYVAVTRAKTNLTIHYNGNYLRSLITDNLSYTHDNNEYSEPHQMALYLTHRDVQLGYFEYVQQRMNNLQSGNTLTILEDGLGNANGELILKYSQQFKQIITERQQNGFRLSDAKVNFIVYWKDEKKEMEVKIILPKITLIK